MSILDPPASGDKTNHFIQGSPATVWTITHNLGKFPSVQVFNSAGDQVEGSVKHISTSQLTITFTAGFSGDAYLN